MRRGLLFLALLVGLIGGSALAQELSAAWRQSIELWAEEGASDDDIEQIVEQYRHWIVEPMNLNDTLNPLPSVPFVSPWQREALRSYVSLYGAVVSIEELSVLPAFDSLTLRLLAPIVYCGELPSAVDVSSLSIPDRILFRLTEDPRRLADTLQGTGFARLMRELARHGHTSLLLGNSGTVEQARGYREGAYEGNNLRYFWRLRYHYGQKVVLQLSADKDPGEAFFTGSHPQGFDFYGFHLMLNDLGRLRRAVVGQYRLQFGQGLTLGSGYGGWHQSAYLCRYAQGIRPSGTFLEYGYQQGAAATVALSRHWDLSAFASYVPRDATRVDSAQCISSLYYSGYHRTASELAKRHTVRETMAGAHLDYRSQNLKLGFTAVYTALDQPLQPSLQTYNSYAFAGSSLANFGADYLYRCGNLQLFGEASMSHNLAAAAVAGGQLSLSNYGRVGVTLHYFSPYYYNLHASACGLGSVPQNQRGASLFAHLFLPQGLEIDAGADLLAWPMMQSRAYAPGHGTEYRLVVSKSFSREVALDVRYRYRERPENVRAEGVPQYLVEQTFRHQVQTDLSLTQGPWRLISRAAFAWRSCEMHDAEHGLLLFQDLQYRPPRLPLVVAARVALFDVSDYDARLYMLERDLEYHYASSWLSDQGCRLYLMVRYDVSSKLSVGFKYGATTLIDRVHFGSGLDQIDGDRRQQWHVNLLWKW